VDDFVRQSIEQVNRADDEAHASSLAWQLGTEVYLAHINQKIDAIRQRIEADYAATKHVRELATEALPIRDSEPSGGTGQPLAGTGGSPPEG